MHNQGTATAATAAAAVVAAKRNRCAAAAAACREKRATMRSKFSSATATLALTCASCEASLVPAFTPQQCSSTSTTTGMQSLLKRSVSMEVQAKPDVGEAGTINSSDNTLSNYPGPVVPRVGGAMPKQRPGWFRVPAPGGKDSKVCVSSINELRLHTAV